jgi:CMP/dCMP kinase
MIIAIDGPAASGKGTLAKQLASHFGLRHLDTGLLYRAVARALIDAGGRLDDHRAAVEAARRIDAARLDEGLLKARGMAEPASIVSAIPEVRAALVDLQRSFATAPPGAVLDGRDIGTVICPEADAKIFVDAAPEVRASRRAAELRAKGEGVDEAAILADIVRRDARDRTRAAAPLVRAADAHLLDTTHLDIDAAFRAAVAIVEAARAGRGHG